MRKNYFLRYLFVWILVVLGCPVLADKKGGDTVRKDAITLMETKWKELIDPKLPVPKNGSTDHWIFWSPSLSTPLPTEWPSVNHAVVFYLYASGTNHGALADGVYQGSTWGKIIRNAQGKLDFSLLTDKIIEIGVQGVRPVTTDENLILNLNPLEFLLKKRSVQEDQKLKSYYCLQLSFGSIPSEIKSAHLSFYDWLDCEHKSK